MPEVDEGFLHLLGVFVVAEFIPFHKWLDIGGYVSKMKESGEEMDSLVGEWLKEHRQKKESGKDCGEPDFMDVLISLIDDANSPAGYDVDTITKSACVSLIAGGSDTTAVMLTWALYMLMNNRRVLEKAQKELDIRHTYREEIRATESDITNLIYLQAIVKETIQLHPTNPLGGIREFTKDYTIGGYHVPKGTMLILPLWKVQRVANSWGDPLEYRPERFLTSHKSFDVKGAHLELIPFAAGKRICPGTAFGLQMLHLVLANVLHAFDFSTPSDESVDMAKITGTTTCKVPLLNVLSAPRLSPSLY